jgi:hypothetical protein
MKLNWRAGATVSAAARSCADLPGEHKEMPMTHFAKLFTAAALVGTAAAPAAAQYYPQPLYPQYPQQYPHYPQQTYPGYGYPGTTGNPVTDIIDQLLGNRYNVTDRQAVRQCARAAASQASSQYGGAYNQGYGGYGQRYGQGYGQGYGAMRVTAITDVQRRSNGLRVTGLLSSGYGNQAYGQAYGYNNRGYGAGQLSFRCNVDYRGAVTGLRVRPAG